MTNDQNPVEPIESPRDDLQWTGRWVATYGTNERGPYATVRPDPTNPGMPVATAEELRQALASAGILLLDKDAEQLGAVFTVDSIKAIDAELRKEPQE